MCGLEQDLNEPPVLFEFVQMNPRLSTLVMPDAPPLKSSRDAVIHADKLVNATIRDCRLHSSQKVGPTEAFPCCSTRIGSQSHDHPPLPKVMGQAWYGGRCEA